MKPFRLKLKTAIGTALIGAGTMLLCSCLNPVGNGDGLNSSGDLPTAVALQSCPDSMITPASKDTSVNPVSFSNDIQPIFTANCITCHGNGTGPGYLATGLDLTVGHSYAKLVNVTTHEDSTTSPFVRVLPGSPDCSYLYQKTSSTSPKFGGQMPLGGPYLSSADIQLIKQWIQNGAPND